MCIRDSCSSDLKNFANSWPSASNFKSFSRSLEQFFLTVGQNNFSNKIPFISTQSHKNLIQEELSLSQESNISTVSEDFPEESISSIMANLEMVNGILLPKLS